MRNWNLQRVKQELSGNRTTTITVAKAYCIPSRHYLTGILQPYHVWFDAPEYDEWGTLDSATGNPLFQTATITVKQAQAVWAEYLILSAKKDGLPIFQVISTMHNPKNAQWAARRKGLPTPWQLQSGTLGEAWKEAGCKPPAKTGNGTVDRVNAASARVALSQIGGIAYTSERRQPRQRTRTRRRR